MHTTQKRSHLQKRKKDSAIQNSFGVKATCVLRGIAILRMRKFNLLEIREL